MKPITKEAWAKLHQKACDLANAVISGDTVMADVHQDYLFEILDDLETEFGIHPEIIATRADYVDDESERRRLYLLALELAQERGDSFEKREILDSLRKLDEET